VRRFAVRLGRRLWLVGRASGPLKTSAPRGEDFAGDLSQRINVRGESEWPLARSQFTFARLEALRQQQQFTSDAAHDSARRFVMLTQTQTA